MSKETIKSLSFGITSGVITTVGLMIGLHSGTNSRLAVVGGIITIAIADAFSDAFGMHMHEESRVKGNRSRIWKSSVSTFLAKFFVALSFVVPLFFLPLQFAVAVNAVYGLVLLSVFSYFVAKASGESPAKAIVEHLFLALAIILATHMLGDWIGDNLS